MSNYSKFLDDLNNIYVDRKLNGIVEKISNDDALASVRDKWIQKGKLTELISFIHTNWDSGNCDEFIQPLTELLIDTKQIDLFKSLWKKIIQYRISAFWTSLEDLKRQTKQVDLNEIAAIDTSNFNMYSKESYKDIKIVVAFRRQFAIEGLKKFRNGLLTLNQIDDSNRLLLFTSAIGTFNKTKFEI